MQKQEEEEKETTMQETLAKNDTALPLKRKLDDPIPTSEAETEVKTPKVDNGNEEKSAKDAVSTEKAENDGVSEEEEDDDYEDDDDETDDEEEENAVVDRKGKGIMIEEEGDNDESDDDDDDEMDDGDEDDDSELDEDPLAEVDLDNILPSRTRRKTVQHRPGVSIGGSKKDDDSDD